MGKISSYAANSSPDQQFLFLGTDPNNSSMGSTGTTEVVSLSTLLAQVPQATSSVYGTIKLSGTSTEYLNGAGAWTTPSGGSGGVPTMNVIWMDALGADNTGATSVTALFNQQLTAAAGTPCRFVFGIGTYLFSAAPDTLGKEQSVTGLGKGLTNFTWSGAGPLFTVTEAVTTAWDGSDNAGIFSGFTIIGPYGTAGTAGIKYGALQGIRLDDLGLYGLDGGAVTGYAVGSTDWAEEAVMTRLDISGCGATSGYVFGFSGTSFDYSLIDAVVVVEAGIDVLALSSGAQMQGLEFGCRGNLHGGTANTGALISLDRGNTAGTSLIGGGTFRVSMEGDGTSAGAPGNVGHYLLWMGSSNAVSQFEAAGTFNVFNAGAPSQGWYNPNNLPASFAGLTVALDGGSMAQGAALAVMGGTRLTSAMDGFAAMYQSTVYWMFGDVQTALLASGAQTLVFAGTDKFIIRGRLLLKQPASGSAATVTWPSNVAWLGGSAPTLSTANGAVDEFDATYLPQESQWRLSHLGTYSS